MTVTDRAAENLDLTPVAQRGADLQRVLDAMAEGIVECDLDGRLCDIRSAAATRWFGPPEPDTCIWDYLHPDDPRQAAVMRLGYEQLSDDFFPFEVAAAQMRTRFAALDRWFGLDFVPVHQDERLVRIVVIVADQTSAVAAECAAQDSRETIAIVQQLIADPPGTRAALDEIRRLLGLLGDAPLRVLLRHLHTLKGCSAVMGLGQLATAAHDAEDSIDRGADIDETLEALHAVGAATWARLDPMMGTRSTLEIQPANLEMVLEKLDAHDEVGGIIRSWRHASMTSLFQHITQHVPKDADKEGKRTAVQIEATWMHAPTEGVERFVRTLTHVVRNAVAHGIETPEEREARGKNPVGRIRLGCWQEGTTFCLRIADDGGGIDWQALAELALQRGLAATDRHALTAFLFDEGVSTRASADDLAGRGQGMGAVAALLAELDGAFDLDSTLGCGTTWTFRIPVGP